MSTGSASEALAAEMAAMESVALRLRELLGEERGALARRDRQALGALAGEKEALVARLDAHGRRQMQLLALQGEPADAAGLEALLARPGHEELAARWARLRPLLAECREQNRVNGGILRIAGQAMGRLLQLVRGQQDAVSLYGPAGTTAGAAEGTFKARV